MNAGNGGGSGGPAILSRTQHAFEDSKASNQERDTIMKTIAKIAAGALMTCGLAVAAAAPANAGVHVGVGIGLPIGPAYVGPAYYGAPCYAYGYRCGYPAYYGPGYVGAAWGGYHGGYRGYWGRPGYWGHPGFARATLGIGHVGVGFGHVGFGHVGFGHVGFGRRL